MKFPAKFFLIKIFLEKTLEIILRMSRSFSGELLRISQRFFSMEIRLNPPLQGPKRCDQAAFRTLTSAGQKIPLSMTKLFSFIWNTEDVYSEKLTKRCRNIM